MLYFRRPFLDASLHLYMRLCPSVGPSVSPSVGPSVGPSVMHSSKTCQMHYEWSGMIGNWMNTDIGLSRELLSFPSPKSSVPSPKKFRWTHLCSDWNLLWRQVGSEKVAIGGTRWKNEVSGVPKNVLLSHKTFHLFKKTKTKMHPTSQLSNLKGLIWSFWISRKCQYYVGTISHHPI